MWSVLQPGEDLLPVQQFLVDKLEQNLSINNKASILSPKQNSINRAVAEYVVRSQKRALVLTSNPKNFQSWRNVIQGYTGPEELSSAVSDLKLKSELTPFTLATYGQLCNPMNATSDEKYSSRTYWEYEVASVGAWDKENDNIGDYDAVKETEVMLNDQAIRQTASYNERLLRFIEVPEHVDLEESGWLSLNFQGFKDKFANSGLDLIICDESYKVTGVWAEVLNHLARQLDNVEIISISPLQVNYSDLSPRNFQLQTSLFASHPIVVKLPMMVRDGCIKAYRGLIKLSRPTEDEAEFLNQANENLQEHLNKVQDPELVTKPLSQFVYEELELLEKDIPGNWSKRRPYVEAILNFVSFFRLEAPATWKIFIQKLDEVTFEKNLPVIRDYIFRYLLTSEKSVEVRLGESLIIAFRPLGFELHELSIEKSTSLIPNILNRSKSKEVCLLQSLTQEFIELQKDLKAVIVCDFIDNTSASEIFPGNEFDGSTCGMISILRRLESTPITLQLNPIVFYGDTIYFNNKYKALLSKEVEKIALDCATALDIVRAEENGYCYIEVRGPENFQNFWRPLFKGLMVNKMTHCLILSREFLNNKWDGVNFNTYFNMSSASSELFGIRFLSRILMKDEDPVASKHLWDFSCVMPEIELGLSDYRRVADRKSHGWHISEDGEFEQGISYFHSSLEENTSEFPEQLIEAVNETAVRLISKRQETAEMWLDKVNESDAFREVLEIQQPLNESTMGKFTLHQLKNKKESTVKASYGELIKNMSLTVMKTVLEVEESEEIPKLEITSRSEGVYRLEVTGKDRELSERIFIAIENLFAEIKNQSYVVVLSCDTKSGANILSRIFSDGGPKLQVPFAVPECFTKKVELGLFLKNWHAMVSNDKMLGHRLPEVKKQVREMQLALPFEFYPQCRICRLLV